MRPYNHLSHLDKRLQRFGEYLKSQRIRFEIFSPDPGLVSESGEIHPVNSPFRFSSDSRGLIRRLRNGFDPNPIVFHHMPVWVEIFCLSK